MHMHHTENVLFVIVFVLAMLPLIGVLLRRASVRIRVLLLALAGAAMMAAIPRPMEDISLERALPVPTFDNGMRSSSSCMGCHPGQYKTWHGSFHRTMTQAASPKSVVGKFEGQRLEWNGQAFVLARRGDEFWITEVEAADRFLDVFSGTGTISFTEKTQPEYLFRTLLPQCVSIMARLP